ncbi:hypothetical protein KBC79_02170 [Candidatus Woesebacteria bacterium]|nr:hypothetical protein [Candidatus Woesebacteria bacterium]
MKNYERAPLLVEPFPLRNAWSFLERTYSPTITHETAQSNWFNMYSYDKVFTDVLQLVAADDRKADWFVEKMRELKQLRKSGMILGSTWRMLSEQHQRPTELYRFYYTLGDFNDNKKKKSKLQKVSEKLLARLEIYEQSRGSEVLFQPASFESFQLYVTSLLSIVRSIMSTNQIVVEEHHRMRDKLRELALYYLSLSMVYDTPESNVLQLYMTSLTNNLGHLQHIYNMAHIYQNFDVHTETMTMEPDHRAIIEMILKAHDIN